MTYTVNIFSRSDYSIQDTSDAAFSITAPTLTLTAPNGGETVNTGTVYDITWTTEGGVGDEVKLELYQGGAFVQVIEYVVPNTGAYAWSVPRGSDAGGRLHHPHLLPVRPIHSRHQRRRIHRGRGRSARVRG